MNRFKSYLSGTKRTTRHILLIAGANALAVGFMISLPQPTHADHISLPRVPANIQVPEGNEMFLETHAVGTQNYICQPTETGFKFVLFGPQATLFNDGQKEVATHYFSPNPFESGTIRATWQHSRDTSTVWGQVKDGSSSSDPAFVAPSAIDWLLVTVVGSRERPKGGDKLSATTFIQRLNTSGGVAPSSGCGSAADVGNKVFVPYRADYFFYKKKQEDSGNPNPDPNDFGKGTG